MSDERRPSSTYASQDHPSGRTSRQTDLELAAKAFDGRLLSAEGRIDRLERDAREHSGDARATRDQLAALHRDFAVITTKLAAIGDAITRIEAQRERGGDRARDITRTVISVVTALAAIVSLVVALASR